MGLILVPSEVKQKTGILKSSVSDLMESYRKALQAVLSFSNSEELKTETYEEMKTKVLEYHQLIAQGMIAVADCILEDAAVLEGSVGSEELDEDLLKENIRKLQNDQQTIRDQISNYQKKRSNPFLSGSQRIKSKIAELVAELEVIEEELRMLNLKLLTLHHISRRTETLFTSVFSTLAAVNAAICAAGVEITGTGMKADLDWEDQLTDDIAQMDEKIRQFIEETLAAELQIDLDEVEEKYGNCVVDRMMMIMKENGIDRLDSAAGETFTEIAIFDITGYPVTKVNGKYQYEKKDFTKEVMMKGFELFRYQYNSEEIAEWYVDNIPTYCHMTIEDIEVNGGPSIKRGRKEYECNLSGNLDGVTVGDDCSSYVWATLVQSGYFDSDTFKYNSANYLPGGGAESEMTEAGFTWHPMSELTADDLKKGDILVKDGHVEIFYGYDKFNRELALSWGDVYKSLPVPKKASRSNITRQYNGIWRIDIWEEIEEESE